MCFLFHLICSILLHCSLLYCSLYDSIVQQEKWTYPGFEGDQFKDHLHSEKSSEEHVEDVHGIIEIFGLSMMLQRHNKHTQTIQ